MVSVPKRVSMTITHFLSKVFISIYFVEEKCSSQLPFWEILDLLSLFHWLFNGASMESVMNYCTSSIIYSQKPFWSSVTEFQTVDANSYKN